MDKEKKFRVTAFIRTKDEKVHQPAEPISAQFTESENGKIMGLFWKVKTLAQRQYGEKFRYISCLRVSIVESTYRVKAFLNIEHQYVSLTLPLNEGDRDYGFKEYFEHLVEIGATMHGEQFDGISYLKFFLLDEQNVAVNFT